MSGKLLPFLLGTALCILTYVQFVDGINGHFFTNGDLTGKKRTNPLPYTPPQVNTIDQCKIFCTMHPECDSYAYMESQSKCELYNFYTKENELVDDANYDTYVRSRTEAEGFYKFEDELYITIVKMPFNFGDAHEFCKPLSNGGELVRVENQRMDDFLSVIMNNIMQNEPIWIQWIYEDNNWRYIDGSIPNNPRYFNWDVGQGGSATSKKCVMKKSFSGKWQQDDCNAYRHFACQLPLY